MKFLGYLIYLTWVMFITHQIVIIILMVFVTSSPIKILDKGVLLLERNSIAMQFFLDLENDDKSIDCHLYFEDNRCCLIDKDDKDCDSIKLSGTSYDLLKSKDRTMYFFFYLTMFQLNQQGYCDMRVNYCCGFRTTNKTEEAKIYFDTRPHKKKLQYLLKNYNAEKPLRCKTADEDPLNNCLPVKCDYKYHGAKPFYDKKKHKCVETPECVTDLNKTLPDIVYDPISNMCKDLDHALTIADIYAINSGLGVIIQSNLTNDFSKAIVLKTNSSTISQNIQLLKDMLFGKLNSERQCSEIDMQKTCSNAFKSILYCILGVSVLLLLFVCCANCMINVCDEWRSGHLSEKVNNLKTRIKSKDVKCETKHSRLNRDVTNKLLKEVIVSDLPLELRDSVVDICERIGKEVRWKKRYRLIDAGSEINLKPVDESTDTSTTSDLDNSEKERLLKK